jgi:hypothetical protein
MLLPYSNKEKTSKMSQEITRIKHLIKKYSSSSPSSPILLSQTHSFPRLEAISLQKAITSLLPSSPPPKSPASPYPSSPSSSIQLSLSIINFGLEKVSSSENHLRLGRSSHRSDRAEMFLEEGKLQGWKQQMPYDEFKVDKLQHKWQMKERALEEMRKESKEDQQREGESEGEGRIQAIFLFWKQLRKQVGEKWKEHGKAMDLLWDRYFQEISRQGQKECQIKQKELNRAMLKMKMMRKKQLDKNKQILEMEKKLVNAIETNKELQEMLGEWKDLYKKQKADIDILKRENKNLLDEIYFFMPGYHFYYQDVDLRNEIGNHQPNRIQNEITEGLRESRFALYGDAQRLSVTVFKKGEFQARYEQLLIEHTDLREQVLSLRKKIELDWDELELRKVRIEDRDRKILELTELLRSIEEGEIPKNFVIKKKNSSSVETQTDDDPEILGLILNAKEHRSKMDTFKNNKKQIKKIKKLKNAKTQHETPLVVSEINKIIARQFFKTNEHSQKIIGDLSKVLPMIKDTLEKRLSYIQPSDSIESPPSITLLLYEGLLSKYKNEKIALRNYEKLLSQLRSLRSKDFRIDFFLRLIIPDHHSLPSSLLPALLRLLSHLPLSDLFTPNLSTNLPLQKAERLLSISLPHAPIRFLHQSLSTLHAHTQLFLADKLTFVARKNLEYYR